MKLNVIRTLLAFVLGLWLGLTIAGSPESELESLEKEYLKLEIELKKNHLKTENYE